MSSLRSFLLLLLLLQTSVPRDAGATQRPSNATPMVASTDVFQSIGSAIELADGRIAVNDPVARRIVLLNTQLHSERVLLDSLRVTDRPTYGAQRGALFRWAADTLLFVDVGADALLLLRADGSVVRTFAAPAKVSLLAFLSGEGGYPAMDVTHRVVVRGSLVRPRPSGPPSEPGIRTIVADSIALLRVSLETGNVDTLTYLQFDGMQVKVNALPGGGFGALPYIRARRPVDAWAARANGSVLIVRGKTLRIDEITPERTILERDRWLYPWERLSDSAKSALVDSAVSVATGRSGAPSSGTLKYLKEPAEQVADYYPAFVDQGGIADAENRVWIRLTATTSEGEPIYAVLTEDGAFERYVVLPRQAALVGFLRDSTVLIGAREPSGLRLQRWALSALPSAPSLGKTRR
ncbi:MAG: hypothetical protein WCL36_10365 [bacterium]|jgi:hypothetical protein